MTTEERKKYMREYHRKYRQTPKRKEYTYEYNREYEKRPERKEYLRKHRSEYNQRMKIERPWYSIYRGAKRRCVEPEQRGYRHYGGRGIKFKMKEIDFEHLWFRDNAFLMDKPSIDRIDSNGNYELSNCRFIELLENLRRRHHAKHTK